MLIQSYEPTAWDLKFRALGVDARIHPSFWLGGMMFSRRSAEIWELAAGVATLFMCIFVHEMGHALCGRFFGDRVPSISLTMMGGYYSQGSIQLWHGKKIWLCLWGPLAGFVLGGIAFGVLMAAAAGVIPVSEPLIMITMQTIWICVIWGVVNLLPIFPLDGGQIFLEIVRWKFPQLRDSFCYLSSMILAGVVSAGCVLTILFNVRLGFGMFTAILFAAIAYQNYQLWQHSKLVGDYEEEEARQPWERDADWWKNQ